MSRPANLEKDLVLALELDLAVVEPARKQHGAIHLNQLLGAEPLVFGGVRLGMRNFCRAGFDGSSARFGRLGPRLRGHGFYLALQRNGRPSPRIIANLTEIPGPI